MNVATVFDSSLPDSIMRRQSGMISVVSRKLITSCSSVWGVPAQNVVPNYKVHFVHVYISVYLYGVMYIHGHCMHER